MLRNEGVVDTRREGKSIFYSVADPSMLEILAASLPSLLSKGRMMTIDWNHFTPLAALAGGVLIGIAAAMFVLLNGRIAGISGVLGGLLRPAGATAAWRIAFVLGLVGAPLVYLLFAALPKPQIDAGYGALMLAGPARRRRHALRLRLHQRPRRLRPVATVAALAGRHGRLHGRRLRHGVRDAPPARYLRSPS